MKGGGDGRGRGIIGEREGSESLMEKREKKCCEPLIVMFLFYSFIIVHSYMYLLLGGFLYCKKKKVEVT